MKPERQENKLRITNNKPCKPTSRYVNSRSFEQKKKTDEINELNK